MRHLPPTPEGTLTRARDMAWAEGLKHVYVGNLLVAGAGDTLCPSCGKPVLRRMGYTILENTIRDGRCPNCRAEIYGVWN